jgi:hypothetical protein
MYQPKFPPMNPGVADLARYVDDELHAVAQAQQDTRDFIQLNVLNRAPIRPRDGMLIEADGTHFDPGSGAGCYIRRAGVWIKLG